VQTGLLKTLLRSNTAHSLCVGALPRTQKLLTFLKFELAFSWLLFTFLLFFYNQGAEGMFFATGLIVWICGPLFLIGLVSYLVYSKRTKMKVSNNLFIVGVAGFISVVIFTVSFSISNGT
jgi:hypothetical protein